MSYAIDPRERDAKMKKEKERQALLDRAYERVINSRLDKLTKKKETTGKTTNIYNCTL